MNTKIENRSLTHDDIAYAFDHLMRFAERRVVFWKGRA